MTNTIARFFSMFDFIRCHGPWLPQKHAGLLSSHEFLATVDHHRVQIPTTTRDRAVQEVAPTKDRSHGTTVHSSKRRANNDGAGANEPPRKGVREILMMHVGGTRCVTSSTDHMMNRQGRF
jgi:hypothetical protein